jgi:hypothetical protein
MRLSPLERREVPAEWETVLAEFSPRTNTSKWLKLIWEEGYPWEPVGRWIIYEMIPGEAVPYEILDELENPAPPSARGNYYDKVLQKFVNNPDVLITERAWRMWKQFGAWGRPYWVIQGERGGHKRWFSNNEKKFLKLAGLPHEPSPPGDLPYAPFDERVMQQLRKQELLSHTHDRLLRTKQIDADAYRAREDATERQFRIELVDWLKLQVEQIAGDVHSSLSRLDAPRRDMSTAEIEALEKAEENFIETGHVAGLKKEK